MIHFMDKMELLEECYDIFEKILEKASPEARPILERIVSGREEVCRITREIDELQKMESAIKARGRVVVLIIK